MSAADEGMLAALRSLQSAHEAEIQALRAELERAKAKRRGFQTTTAGERTALQAGIDRDEASIRQLRSSCDSLARRRASNASEASGPGDNAAIRPLTAKGSNGSAAPTPRTGPAPAPTPEGTAPHNRRRHIDVDNDPDPPKRNRSLR